MHDIRIRRCHARYRLPERDAGARRRLDAILASALGQALDTALAALPLGPREELCIRHLAVSVRLNLGISDLALARAWAEALAAAVAAARPAAAPAPAETTPSTPDGAPIEVRWFSSREHALLELAFQAARGRPERLWPWRQLDLWRGADPSSDADATRELVRTLARHPGSILPTFRALARLHALAPLVRRFAVPHWVALAAAALDHHGVPLDARDLAPLPPTTGAPSQSPRPGDQPFSTRSPEDVAAGDAGQPVPPAPARATADVERAERTSTLARAFPARNVPDAARPAWRALVLLDADPGWASRPRPAWQERLHLPEADLAFPSPPPDPSPDRSAPAARRVPDPSVPPHESVPDRPRRPAARGGKPGSANDSAAAETRPAPEFTPAEPDSAVPHDPRRRGSTRFGGLLLLLNLLPSVGFPALLADAFPDRTVRWVLHRLALRLLAPAGTGPSGAEASPDLAHDPAVLAFAGLPPDAPAPGSGEDPDSDPVEAESARLDALAARVEAALERHVPAIEAGAGRLLDWVCRREALIVADPGWFEVRFRLRDVSTALRRVGLDLDPGFIPWLGVVLRFAYE